MGCRTLGLGKQVGIIEKGRFADVVAVGGDPLADIAEGRRGLPRPEVKRPEGKEIDSMATKWSMKGTLLGACSCDWGCPCSFDARPTLGWCEGGYIWKIDQGNVGGVKLDGLSWAWFGHAPGAMHEGNVTWMVLTDQRATPEQRQALATLAEGKSGGPWVIFMAIATKRVGPDYVPFEFQMNGLNSKAKVGDAVQMELGPILNPVTGEPEEVYLDKPTGFTSKRLTLGASKVFRVNGALKYDHSGKYGEFSQFEYSGEIAN